MCVSPRDQPLREQHGCQTLHLGGAGRRKQQASPLSGHAPLTNKAEHGCRAAEHSKRSKQRTPAVPPVNSLWPLKQGLGAVLQETSSAMWLGLGRWC